MVIITYDIYTFEIVIYLYNKINLYLELMHVEFVRKICIKTYFQNKTKEISKETIHIFNKKYNYVLIVFNLS